MPILKKILFFVCFLVIAGISVFSQQPGKLSTQSKKAEKFFMDAIDWYNRRDYTRAADCLQRAIREDKNFTEAWILQGDMASDQRNLEEAINDYSQALKTNPDFSANLYYILANIELTAGRYGDARTHYGNFLLYQNTPKAKKDRAADGISACDFAIRMMQNPVPFKPVNMGDSINTPFDEYINAITSDDLVLYFTRKIPKDAMTIDQSMDFEEDFFYSVRRPDSVWGKALNLGPPVNTHGNEGALSIAPDGQHIFFAACNREDGMGSCDIYWARKTGNAWSEPENLGPVVNSPQWDSQPSFSSDGKTLYFASKRPGGKGSSDIWKAELLPGGQWTTPVNLGDSVNTPLEEQAPFIHPDDQTLYFSSRGHPGMGGLDLFYCRKLPDGSWNKAVNMGYPINTFADEITLVVNAKGDLAYISSDMLGGKGRQDVYSFPLYKEARPVPVTYFKGTVFDKENGNRLEASFELIDLGTGRTVIHSLSDPMSGEFLLCLPTERNYALNVFRNGYLFYSDNFMLTGTSSQAKPYHKDIPLQPVKVGESVILKNIFFDTDKYDLKPESRYELEKLTELLKKNPTLRVEISGHTDNVGAPAYNMDLSTNRAKAVVNYLINAGIAASRMTSAGYGLTRPIDTNDTDAGRANNRRTEFKIVGK